MKYIYEIYQTIKNINQSKVSLAQCLSLAFIADNGNVTARKLATYLRITPAGMTPHIDALERDGYLERVPSKDDRRQNLLRITQTGITELAAWKNALKNV